ncbi:uncharacterized protein LOC124553641 isoform X3 [Schistocerca americana]|uniref:uncharacterized protein LOC124553641 isoform X3 n=1 Tax=Schistocerca americana TaxID=7009 RepID=UPI001F5029F8|nr:uncharacterized protein LOC124553641 isoform X3 [Schistocerca americana]
MGDTKTVWLEKEEIDEVQVYPSSVKIKEELQEDVNQEFPEDPLKFEKLDFNMNEGPELNFHLDASEHNHVEVPFVLPVPTHIKEDPELNLEAEETENIIDAYTEFCIRECDPVRIEKEKEVAPRRCAPDSTWHCGCSKLPGSLQWKTEVHDK